MASKLTGPRVPPQTQTASACVSNNGLPVLRRKKFLLQKWMGNKMTLSDVQRVVLFICVYSEVILGQAFALYLLCWSFF